MKSLSIQNYKCLKKLEIQDLKRVNLFTGRNNTGKSSVLEAISLLAAKGNLAWLRQLFLFRDELQFYNYRRTRDSHIDIASNLKLLSSLFYDRAIDFDENEILLHSGSDKGCKISFTYKKTDVPTLFEDGNEMTPALEINFNSNIITRDLNHYLFNVSNHISNLHFINTKDIGSQNNASLWDNITLSDKENLVIEALQIIEPRIARLSFVGDGGYNNARHPVVKLSGSSQIYPLASMGDGINRILHIILALVNSDSGSLFIDEFENGLHYSVQADLWKILFRLSEQLDTQVFATTHSNDSVVSFAQVLEKNEDFEGSLYRLAKKDENIEAYTFPKDEIIEATHQHINLR